MLLVMIACAMLFTVVYSEGSASAAATGSGVSSPALNQTYKQVKAGTYYSVGLRSDGTVWTWGRNLFGELGIEKKATITSFPYPLRLPSLTGITTLSVDGQEGYQLGVKADGTVWEWGRDPFVYRQSILPRQVQGINGVAAVSSSGGIASAMLNNGTVVAWARLGGEDTSAVNPVTIAGLTNVTAISTQGMVNYAIVKDGSVYAWYAKLDDNRNVVLSKPWKLAGVSNVKQVSSIWDTGYAVNANGQMWSWKLTVSSKLAISYVTKPARIFSSIKVRSFNSNLLLSDAGVVYNVVNGKLNKVSGLPAVSAISRGGYHQLAIDKQGHVWGWGANKWFETGSPTSAEGGMVYTPAQLQSGVDIVLNDNRIDTIVPAYESDSTVQIPIKLLAAELGIRFSADSDGTITLARGKSIVTIHRNAGDVKVYLNGKPLELKSSIGSSAGSITIPYELLASLEIGANWDAAAHRLSIMT
ncbi:Regulator of Chromosome Condensation (RCC1) repeat protein [Paenibacillus cellulosilyticus]|uniref:Regulator of Chromosome Condensation (RCC1) repeat protein n=2 Tax=Paenibacillus cellulosilyticus TaxID=375489 RepID=A0A2V2YV21_9BACL|nr:Regulator of Chromosome Condensation (RCC1) repeat protein [Paenibacillus cellulosilyticus]